jgi:diguanylate cyclase (GGDEF)-like protein
MEKNTNIKHPALLYLYTGSIIMGAALLIPQLITLSAATSVESIPAIAVLVVIVFLLNMMQYTMSDDFSFSLAIIPELAGLFLFGPAIGLLLIMITLLTNIIYRFITKENSLRESLFKFFLNTGVLTLSLAAAQTAGTLLQLDINQTADFWKFFILVILFGCVNNFLLVGFIKILTDKWIFQILTVKKIGLYILFSVIFTTLSVYSFLDRGIITMTLLLVMLPPVQCISQNSHKIQTQSNALIKDALTGMFNYHYLKTHLSELLKKQTPFAFALADLDYFKEINDTYGHVCGNEVLKYISREFQRISKKEGMVFRYGGDEFCYLTSSEEELDAVLNRWDTINNQFLWNGASIRVGFSVGTLYYDGKDPATFESIISQADQEMYRKKIERKLDESTRLGSC